MHYLLRAVLAAPAVVTEAVVVCGGSAALLAPTAVPARAQRRVPRAPRRRLVFLRLAGLEARIAQRALIATEAGCADTPDR